jgi:predicted outer membrane repeat protein
VTEGAAPPLRPVVMTVSKLLAPLAAAAAFAIAAPVAGAATTFTVNAPYDATDAKPGDGFCDDGAGFCTLRAAIQETNALPGPDNVFLPPGVYRLTLYGAGEDAAATGDLDVTGTLDLFGGNPARTIVDGQNADRVFDFLPGSSEIFWGMTVRGGRAPFGGGIAAAEAGLWLGDMIFVANNAANGGGLYASLSNPWLDRVTFIDNSASGYGGAIFDGGNGNPALATVLENVTISGNGARRAGGGIALSSKEIRMTNVTIARNNAPIAGGVYARGSTPNFLDSIIAYNGGGDCGPIGGFASWGSPNLDSDGSCALSGPGTLSAIDPLLDGLDPSLGPTPVRPLLPGSPAIDTGSMPSCTGSDQRYLPRPQGLDCDLGAVEMP